MSAIIILGIVLAVAIAAIVVLSAALMLAVEQINQESKPDLELPPLDWDYTIDTGWVEAEVEEDE